PHLAGHPSWRDRPDDRHGFDAADAAGRAVAHHVWRLAACDDRIDAACGARRGCARSPAQFAHRLYEPGLALSVLEHELPYRASHVSDGALSRIAGASCGTEVVDAQALC